MSRIIFFDFSLNGLWALLCCRSAWSACRWLWLSIFFTSSRTLKQLHAAIQTPWSRCLFPRAVWTNRVVVHFRRVSPFLFDLRLRFRLRLCLYLNVQQTLARNSSQVSPCLRWCFRSQTRHVCRFPEHPNRMVAHSYKSPCSYNWVFGFWLCLLGVFTTSSNFWTQLFHPIVFKGNLRRRPRWRIYFLVKDFSSFHHDSLRDTISWECVVKDDCVRSCLIELEWDCVLNDLEELGDEEFLVLMDQYNIEIFSCFLRLLPYYTSTFHQTNVESTQIRSEDNLLFSRIQSLYLLLEVDHHDEEQYSVVLTLGKRWANDLLAQYQSKFFPRWVQFLSMSRQQYVFVVLLWPLIGSQKQVHSSSTQTNRTPFQRFPARCCRPPCCCCLSPWPTYSSHDQFWLTSENCLCLQIQF